jgi:hypothetical protein
MPSLPRRQSAVTFALLVGLSSLSVAGCAGDLDPALKGGGSGTAGTGGTVCDAPAQLGPKCGQLGCHQSPNAQGGLDLKAAGIAARLKAAPTPGANISCTDAQRTAYLGPASNVMSGFLFQKLMTTPPCGASMPELPGWNASDTTCLTEWATAVVNGTVQ